MKPIFKILAAAALVTTLTACDDDDIADLLTGDVRVLHTSPDAPPVNILFDGDSKIDALDYAESSGFEQIVVGDYKLEVEAIIPGGNATVLTLDPLEIESESRITALAIGKVEADSLELFPVADSASDPASDEVAVVVVHASPAAGSLGDVDVYVTAPGAALENPITFGFKGIADAGAIPAGKYQVRITPANDAATILFDSGEIDLGPFSGQKLLIAAIDEADQLNSSAPVKLLVANDDTSLNILDKDSQSGARAVHLSPDASTVDVFANKDSSELIPGFKYLDTAPAANDYVALDAGDYVFDVAPANTGIGGSVYTSDAITLEAGMDYSMYAVGYVFNSPAFMLVPDMDDNRSIATQASLKAVHGAAAVGTVDVYVTPAGQYSVADVAFGQAGSPLVPDFEFGKVTDYVPVPAGSYDVRIVDQTSSTVVINLEGASLSNGDVVTAIAYGPDETDGNPNAAGLLLLSN
jgi:hypothetical protein